MTNNKNSEISCGLSHPEVSSGIVSSGISSVVSLEEHKLNQEQMRAYSLVKKVVDALYVNDYGDWSLLTSFDPEDLFKFIEETEKKINDQN